MVYFLTLEGISLYLLNFLVKKYWKHVFFNPKNSKKILLLTVTENIEKVLDKLLESDELSWKLVAVSVLDKSDFQHDKIPVIEKEKLLNLQRMKLWMRCLSIFQERAMILEKLSLSLRQWG